jgi:tRNA(fMet)-specific endonuclease VapC
MFLLDTNTLIYFFKGQGKVPERLLATPPGGSRDLGDFVL